MKVTITTTKEVVTIELQNETNGNDLKLTFTPEDARVLAEKILLALATE